MNNNYYVLSNIGNIDVVDEWINLLNYRMFKNKKNVYELYKKTVKELTIDELDILKKYKENKRNISILKKYKFHQCDEQEFIEVHNLIQKPLANEILDELSKDELIEAREKINKYLNLPDDYLSKIINDMKTNIIDISLVDMYVLNIIFDVNFTHSLSEINKIK